MSTRRKMVEVFPTPGAKIEQIDMGEFECPACNGRGVVVSSTTPYTTEYGVVFAKDLAKYMLPCLLIGFQNKKT